MRNTYAPKKLEQIAMDLETFVANSLSSIIEGVRQAQERYPAGSGPSAINHVDRAPEDAATPAKPTQVSFDIAVTAVSETETTGERKGGINIKVADASIGRATGQKARNEAVSRIAFTVPVSLPVTHTSDSAEKVRKLREQYLQH